MKLKRRTFYFIAFIHLFIDILYVIVHYPKLNFAASEEVKNKTILLWSVSRKINLSEYSISSDCSGTGGNCRIMTNTSTLPFHQYDAVVINARDLSSAKSAEVTKYNRSTHQRFVILAHGPKALAGANFLQFTRFFNWTMSYKSESDVHIPNGRVNPKQSAPKTVGDAQQLVRETHNGSRNFAEKKTRKIIWKPRVCRSNSLARKYINELRRFITVDVAGPCGVAECPPDRYDWAADTDCYDVLAEGFKFYLSFEDSYCRDYVSEDFFRAMAHEMVPVVFGGANYSAIAPFHSFIDAMEFTPPQLALYLRKLAANDALYNEFFWWKDHYDVEVGSTQMARRGFCDLCRRLVPDQ